jgi:hypothetical protein
VSRAAVDGEVRLSRSQLGELARLVAAELAAQQAGPGMTVREAREYVGVSWDFFHEHVMPEVRVARRGSRKILLRAELDRWLDENAELVLGDNHNERKPR